MRIIPAIDLIDGKCVRLRQGDFNQKTDYADNPARVAQNFEAHGITYLHLVDLDGAKSGETVHWDVLSSISRDTSLKVDFGGGVKTRDGVRRALSAGATQVVLGSVSLEKPDQVAAWGREFGFDRFVLAADVRGTVVAKGGWLESGEMEILDYVDHFKALGFNYFLCTDISRDGMLSGPAIALYQSILDAYPLLNLIASGGIRNTADLIQLRAMGMEAAVIGVAIYEGKITLEELSELC